MHATMNSSSRFRRMTRAVSKLRSEIVLLVNELHLHNNRIEALIDQLYGINRKIMSINSGMVSWPMRRGSTAANSSTNIRAT